MSDHDLFNYVQTVLEDREVSSEERVTIAMSSIVSWVRAEFGLSAMDPIGDVPPEWEHKVPKAPVVTPEIDWDEEAGILRELDEPEYDYEKKPARITYEEAKRLGEKKPKPYDEPKKPLGERWRDWWMGPQR